MSNYVSTGYVAAGYISIFDTVRDFTFYGPDKIIEISYGVTSIEVQDIYSAWKEWVLISDNVKYLPAMRSVGGDPISDTKTLGATYFITNGWRVRPFSGDHRLTVNGNLYTDPAGSSPFLPAAGAYSVTIELQVSSLVDSSLAQMPEIEQASYSGQVAIDTTTAYTGITYPTGTLKQAVNNLYDGRAGPRSRRHRAERRRAEEPGPGLEPDRILPAAERDRQAELRPHGRRPQPADRSVGQARRRSDPAAVEPRCAQRREDQRTDCLTTPPPVWHSLRPLPAYLGGGRFLLCGEWTLCLPWQAITPSPI